MSKINNTVEQFEAMRIAAEEEAQAIMNARNAPKRTAAEKEAQSIMSVRNAAMFTVSHAQKETGDDAKNVGAQQKRTQVEVGNQIRKSKSYKLLGCLSLIILIITFWGFTSAIKSCQDEREESEADPIVKIDPSLDIKNQLAVYYDWIYEINGFYELSKDGKYGLATANGVVVCKPKYDNISFTYFDFGLIVVSLDSKYGFLNSEGIQIMTPKYEYYESYNDTGIIEVMLDEKFGLFTAKGEVVKPQYSTIDATDDETGLAIVEKDDKYGLLNMKTFKEVTPCIYNLISDFDGGLYEVTIDNKIGYLNKDGSVFQKPE